MADEFTPNLNFTKPEPGASDDTWGEKTNTNWDIADAAIESKADKVSPAFSGVPTAPTAAPGTNTDQLATTAFVIANGGGGGGSGDVVGPAGVVDDLPAIFDGITGKLLKSKTYAAFKALLALVKGDVGLGNVDNTSDVNKPISTATQTALNTKQPLDADLTAIAALTTQPYGRSLLELLSSSALRVLLEVRTKLVANTTFWIRSDAGTDVGKTGATNTAGDAFLTWQGAYNYLAANFDSGGNIVTLKSGTAGVYADPLYMFSPIVGGGQLILDGNGCGIGAVGFKAILNNCIQSTIITIQNFGGTLSSTTTSIVENAAASNMNIGAGNSFGSCVSAVLAAIQGGNIFCNAAMGMSGSGGGQFVYVGFGSTVSLIGATLNVSASRTFSLGFAVAEMGGNIKSNGFVTNLGGNVITGKRYAVKGGCIETGNDDPNHFPGTLPGTVNGGSYNGKGSDYVNSSTKFASATVTMTIPGGGAPTVVTWPGGIPYAGAGNWTAPFRVASTTGATPTGVVVNTQYWVIGSTVSGNTHQIADSIINALNGVAVVTSGSQSGVHTGNTTVNLTTSLETNVGAVKLERGSWEVWGNVAFNPAGSTTSSYYGAWTHTASATFPPQPTGGYSDTRAAFTAGNAPTQSAGHQRVDLQADTIVYLECYASFAVSTNGAMGFIGAQRT